MQQNIWVRSLAELSIHPDEALYQLLQAYSLSSALQQVCSNLTVEVITQQLATASDAEQDLLVINETQSFVREVHLLGDGQPLVHARVVAPFKTYTKYQTVFDNLGNKLLGESFLYQQPHTRSEFEFAYIDKHWLRRSVFHLNEHELLVTEIFLPWA